MGGRYSEEEKAEIQRLYLIEGLSASEIAKRRGRGETRNAMIGIIGRMGLTKTPTQLAHNRSVAVRQGNTARARNPGPVKAVAPKPRPPQPPAPPQPPKERPEREKPGRILASTTGAFVDQATAPADPRVPIPPPADRPPEPGDLRGPTLAALPAKACKWPLGLSEAGEREFCGHRDAASAAGPYCAGHTEKAAQPVTPAKRASQRASLAKMVRHLGAAGYAPARSAK